MTFRILAITALAVSLSACATGAKLTPAQSHQMFIDWRDAGCGGRVDIEAGAAAGQLGGEVHANLGLHGECPTLAEKAAAEKAASDKAAAEKAAQAVSH